MTTAAVRRAYPRISVNRLLPAIGAAARSHLLLPRALIAGVAAGLGLLLPIRLLAIHHRSVRIDAERQHAPDLACRAADRSAQLRITEGTADGAAQRLTDLADRVAEPALRRHLPLLRKLRLLRLLDLLLRQLLRVSGGDRIRAERQQASKLSGGAAYRASQLRIAEQAADRAAQRLPGLAEQIAEEALRRNLTLLALLALLPLLT